MQQIGCECCGETVLATRLCIPSGRSWADGDSGCLPDVEVNNIPVLQEMLQDRMGRSMQSLRLFQEMRRWGWILQQHGGHLVAGPIGPYGLLWTCMGPYGFQELLWTPMSPSGLL